MNFITFILVQQSSQPIMSSLKVPAITLAKAPPYPLHQPVHVFHVNQETSQAFEGSQPKSGGWFVSSVHIRGYQSVCSQIDSTRQVFPSSPGQCGPCSSEDPTPPSSSSTFREQSIPAW